MHSFFSTLHTNVRLEHFAVGVRTSRNIVYLTSFGRSFCLSGGDKRQLPANEGLRTDGVEPSPSPYSARDPKGLTPLVDVEAWLYVAVEIFNKDCVPWNKKPKMASEELLEWKKAFLRGLCQDEETSQTRRRRARFPASYNRWQRF